MTGEDWPDYYMRTDLWTQRAACTGIDTDRFMPPPVDMTPGQAVALLHQAAEVCGGCPVRDMCYQYATKAMRWRSHGKEVSFAHGVFGGWLLNGDEEDRCFDLVANYNNPTFWVRQRERHREARRRAGFNPTKPGKVRR